MAIRKKKKDAPAKKLTAWKCIAIALQKANPVQLRVDVAIATIPQSISLMWSRQGNR